MQSVFETLTSALFHVNKIASIDELRGGPRRYVHDENHQRIKLKRKGRSPVEYRTQALGHWFLTVQLLGGQFGRPQPRARHAEARRSAD